MIFNLGCDNKNNQREQVVTSETNDTINNLNQDNSIPYKQLDFGFQIKGIDIETFKEYGVFTKLEIIKDGQRIYEYDNVDEFDIEKFVAYAFKLNGENIFELIFESTSPPSKNRMKLIRVDNSKVVNESEIPSIDIELKNLDADNYIEFAGYWSWSEAYGLNDELTAYNPLIFYEITDNGIKIDTPLTVTINTEIYDSFEGFYYSDNKPKNVKSINKQDEIIRKLNKR